ncbi:Alkaline phosphatase synthesis sensor protein PhoR [bioreactor metagenome]|uniref:histidine kinase n=1 Tax=bioreactor metagenome TaxID=1076179 RepID=A0A645F4U1_9ZZZZ
MVFQICDTGCGIAEVDRDKVFKRFYRADSSRNLPGNGLGLSLVHAVVHAHGGTIVLDTALGAGTCFTVELPRNA